MRKVIFTLEIQKSEHDLIESLLDSPRRGKFSMDLYMNFRMMLKKYATISATAVVISYAMKCTNRQRIGWYATGYTAG